jgi:hypothetical protein
LIGWNCLGDKDLFTLSWISTLPGHLEQHHGSPPLAVHL